MTTISLGNIAMGGRGKTPVAIHLARLLVEAGERPAVLSRGYGREVVEDGVVIVSDGRTLRSDLARSGDEPLLIALSAPGAAVLVCEQRAIAAALAQHALGATVNVLDDGFQHHAMERDLDVVIVTADDLKDHRVPFGGLRESVRALERADAIVIDGNGKPDHLRQGYGGPPELYAKAEGLPHHSRVFGLTRSLGEPVPLELGRPWLATRGPAFVLAAIAEPERFVNALRADGWVVAGVLTFPDHHRYRADDLERVASAAHDAGVNAVVTTEKDAVRLLPLRPLPIPVASVPLEVSLAPLDGGSSFQSWILQKIAEARA